MICPIKRHGGKNAFNGALAKWIISLMQPHRTYCEPYFGGGSVLLHKDPVNTSEVINDIDGLLMMFWHVLQKPDLFERLHRRLALTPFSEAEFDLACGILLSQRVGAELGETPTDIAWAFFVVARQSMSGREKSFAPITTGRLRRGMNEQVSAWLSAVEGLPLVHERMMRVLVKDGEALDLIDEVDSPETLFYLDPPYLDETRTATEVYRYEVTREHHEMLLAKLAHIKGKFILSGYRSTLYDNHASFRKWNRHEYSIVNNASKADKKATMIECCWTNY